ncbi:lipopolysaccharide transport periplasmic protein LptA [Gilvimarinus agarilyticus]|uniref:lipopolysaccharide transport periplasmic protein LptA n=1 Tax=Gilvimarinus agarilyticus TaxID=679259 RepID=UPI000698C535|nr:lipopolysaccharide transport periplasmic protein LptA [Gilvimarinus agarilyticus]
MLPNYFLRHFNKRELLKYVAALIATATIATSAQALPDDREQDFQLQADKQLFDQKNGLVTYTGSARLQQGSLIIDADRIVIHFKSDNSVAKIEATGSPAHFQQQPQANKGKVFAEAREISYNHDERTVTLNSSAKLEQDGAIMQGHSIHYDLTRELINAQSDESSSERIKMVIPAGAGTQ